MDKYKTIMIIILIAVEIMVIVFIRKNNKTGYNIAVSIIALIVGIATILAIPGDDSGSGTNSSDGHTTTIEENEGEESPKQDSADIESRKDLSYEITYEGIVMDYSSFTDFFGHERNDVIYMEYDGSPSSIIIHTNGNYSNISFDFYAVSGMDPEDKAQLTFIADNDPNSIHEYAAIPIYNSSGSFNENISGKNEVKITFHRGAIPSKEYTCAVLIDNLSIQ